jgi:5-methylcytosine-specific restriction endonuclease McrA
VIDRTSNFNRVLRSYTRTMGVRELERVSLNDAKERGLTRYYTGKACKRGHVAERLVSTRACVTCSLGATEKWRSANPQKVLKKERNWYAANIEKAREQNRNWYAANIEKARENHRSQYAANPEKRREMTRNWREANPEKRRAMHKKWAANNPDKVRVNTHRRRARLLNVPGSHTAKDIRALYALQQGRCNYCKIEVGNTWHLDHIMPVSRGGSNNPENLQVLCPSCNLRKHAKLPDKFAKQFAQELALRPPDPPGLPLSLVPEQKQVLEP